MAVCNNVNVEPTVIGGGDGSNAYDAFGRLRVSNPLTIFDSANVMSKIVKGLDTQNRPNAS